MGFRIIAAAWTMASVVSAQGIITTIAGTDPVPPTGPVAATSIYLPYPSGLAADAQGNVYIADRTASVIYKTTPDGTATVIAGTGIAAYSGDGGPARLASIQSPTDVALDDAGNVYFSQFGAVRKIDANGIVSTIAGNGSYTELIADNVPAISERFSTPLGLAAGPGGRLYLSVSNRVLVIQNGIAKYFAGTGSSTGPAGDRGPALSASISPIGLATDAQGNLYISDNAHHAVRKVDLTGVITTVVPSTYTSEVAVDSKGQVYFSDLPYVHYLGTDGMIHLLAGNGTFGSDGDGGPASLASLYSLTEAVATDSSGNVYIADSHVIRKVNSAGVISTEAGAHAPSTGVQPALTVPLGDPIPITFDSLGNLYVGDLDFYLVRSIAPDGTLKTVAGNGFPEASGQPSGPATSIPIYPLGLAVDQNQNLYVASNDKVLRVTPDGAASPFAVGFSDAQGLSFDTQGNLYVADYFGNRIVKVSPAGTPTPFAGNGQTDGKGDGGKATAASVKGPHDIAAVNGNVYFTEETALDQTYRIRMVDSDGIIHTILGNGEFGDSPDGILAATSPSEYISGLAVDPQGRVYFSENQSGRVRMIALDGTLHTIAGIQFLRTFSGDGGPAASAGIYSPQGLALDSAGNLYICDSMHHRIRKVLAAPPSFAVDQTALTFAAQSGGAPAAAQTVSVKADIPGIPFTVTTSDAWLQASVANGATPRQVSIVADPASLSAGTSHGTLTFQAAGTQPSTFTVDVTFTVSPGQPAQLQTDQVSVSFTLPRSGGTQSQPVSVSNAGGGSFTFTAVPTTRTGGNWLTVAPTSGTVTARQPIALNISANAQGLSQGTYSGQVALNAGSAGSQTIQATLTVSAADQGLLLTQTGLSFTAVSGGGLAPSQNFGVKNIGTGALSWTTSPSTTDGAAWLSLSPGTGTSVAGAASPLVSVSVDHTSLAPRQYYGLARVNAPGAANTPQVVTVHLDVLPPGSDPGAVIQPAELVFTTTSSSESAGAREFQVYNLTASPISFRGGFTNNFLFLPYDGVVAPNQPVRILVQPIGAGNVPATGTLSLQFADGQVRSVPLRLEASAAATGSTNSFDGTGRPRDAACSATRLIPTLSVIGQSSTNIAVSWPSGLNVDLIDDCKRPITTGTVAVQFSNGDPPLSLTSNGDGRWQGTWSVERQISPIQLNVTAMDSQTNLTGTAQAIASLQNSYDPPLVTSGGIVSTANPVANQPLAPGSIISIYGQKLSATPSPLGAPAGALPNSLGDATVLLGGLPVPLFYVSGTQINGVVPWNLSTDTQHQLLIQRGVTLSTPVPVSVAQAQPAMFLYPQPNAASQGIFVVDRPNFSASFLNLPTSPAQKGDTLVIYSLGLGTVSNQPATGSPSPASPLAQTITTPVLRIGGQAVPVSFAGLSPLFVGLYQVQATLPAGLATGPQVPVTLEIAGQLSAAVTIALQ